MIIIGEEEERAESGNAKCEAAYYYNDDGSFGSLEYCT